MVRMFKVKLPLFLPLLSCVNSIFVIYMASRKAGPTFFHIVKWALHLFECKIMKLLLLNWQPFLFKPYLLEH